MINDLANIASVDVLSGIQYHSSCFVSLSSSNLTPNSGLCCFRLFPRNKIIVVTKMRPFDLFTTLTGTVAVTDWNDNFTRCLRHPSRCMELIYNWILRLHQMLRGSSRPTTTELLSLCIHIFLRLQCLAATLPLRRQYLRFSLMTNCQSHFSVFK